MTRSVEYETTFDHAVGVIAPSFPEGAPTSVEPAAPAVQCDLIADRFASAYPGMADLGWLTAPLVRPHPPLVCLLCRGVKRVADAVLAALLLVLLLPLMALVALMIRLESPGPTLFRQDRVGSGGRFFVMLKFRTMVDGAADQEASMVSGCGADPRFIKIDADPRVTRLGCFLRKSSIDELPQLWNVVLGHMSLVGPRPSQPGEVAHYDSTHFVRLLVKPGITGLWQVSGRSDLGFEQAVELDRWYVAHWSLWLDIKILVRTVGTVFGCKGAC